MRPEMFGSLARYTKWFLRRNPLYLVSAGLAVIEVGSWSADHLIDGKSRLQGRKRFL